VPGFPASALTRVGSRFWAALWAVGALLATPLAGQAQSVVNSQYRELYDQAFRATYEHPADVAAALNFAKVARLAGDLEGAVGALERVLIYNPDLAVVDLQLGLLYRALGSPDAARVHLQHADPTQLSADDRALREKTLAELDSELSRHKLAGQAAFGLGYQTNVNAGALGAAQLAGGTPAIFNSLRARADVDAFGAVTVTHSYDLGDQAGDTWESRMSLYATRQFERHLDNISVAEIETGPRFRFGDSSVPTLRPYGVGSVFELGGQTYFVSDGGGLNSHVVLSPRWSLDGTVEMRNVSYFQSSLESSAPDYDARQSIGRLVVAFAPTSPVLITAAVQLLDYAAREAFDTYQEARLAASFTRQFTIPGLAQPWAASLYGGPAERQYHSGDPDLPQTMRRQDGEWDLGGSLAIGLTEQTAFRLTVSQIWANSNIALYEYRNTAVLGSIELRF
jgi:tetratricopeptide (TPR) repeat protein